MTSLHAICSLGPLQSKIPATPMPAGICYRIGVNKVAVCVDETLIYGLPFRYVSDAHVDKLSITGLCLIDLRYTLSTMHRYKFSSSHEKSVYLCSD